MAEKNIKYINREFDDFKKSLIDYTKSYFPNTYNDFSEYAPGMMFLELAAYVGDVLSFYQDTQFQENLIQYAQEKENLYSLAYMLGYKPKVTSTSLVDLDVYQLLPVTTSGSATVPDFNYTVVINEGTQVKTNNNIFFYIKDKIDFSLSSSLDPTEITVYSIDGSNLPSRYLLKKKAKAISGQIKTLEVNMGSPTKFPSFTIDDDNIIDIISIVDSDDNEYTEVPYLAQETIFEEVANNEIYDPNFIPDGVDVPYLLRLKKVPRRFVTRIKTNSTLEVQFGSGVTTDQTEEIIPNPDNIGLGTSDGSSKLNRAYDPSNFLLTNTYGIAPYDTTLTVKYLVGGGVESNVDSNTINDIDLISVVFSKNNLSTSLTNEIQNSISINNPYAASGGGDGDEIEDLRLKSLANFPAQMRAVTLEDYVIRTLNLPPKFGTVSKVYIVQDSQLSNNNSSDNIIDNNPLSLSAYILSCNNNKQLKTASSALKNNIKTYLSQFKLLTDSINIKNAFIINIGVQFNIIVLPNYNSNQVLLECITELKKYFDIDKWQINQPIFLNELYILLSKVKGVQTVKNIEITNKTGESLGYSKYGYDIKGATLNNVVYPSLDPSIFEIKYPDQDIIGRSDSL